MLTERAPLRFLKVPLLWWFLLLCWAGTLWWLSSRSHLPGPQGIPHLDKVAHATFFFFGGIVAFTALRVTFGPRVNRLLVLIVMALSLYGATDEWHQLHTPGRSGGDFWDWLADTVGAFFGVWMAKRAINSLVKPVPAES